MLKAKTGCYSDILGEVWYYNNALDPVQSLEFQAVNTTKFTCPSIGIKYYERSSGSEK